MPRITIYADRQRSTALAMILVEGEYEFRVEPDAADIQLQKLRNPNPPADAPRLLNRQRRCMEILMVIASQGEFKSEEVANELRKHALKGSSAGPTISKASRTGLIERSRDGGWKITDTGVAFVKKLAKAAA